MATQLSATLTLSDGSTRTVTTDAKWRSSNPRVLKVTTKGAATAVSSGSSTVTATYEDVSGTCTVTVPDPERPELDGANE